MRFGLFSSSAKLLSKPEITRAFHNGRLISFNERYRSDDPFERSVDFHGRRSGPDSDPARIPRGRHGVLHMDSRDNGRNDRQYGGRFGNRNEGRFDNRFAGRQRNDGRARVQYDSEQEQELIVSRNRRRNQGQDDGLRGEEDYAIDTEALKEFDWETLKQEIPEGYESKPGFSGIPVSALSKHKLLSRVLVNSLIYNRNYTELTDVQVRSLLPILQGDSVMVRAKTGTGKTAAFAVPLIQQVLKAKQEGVRGVKAVIVTPTRELAQQIADEIFAICQYGTLGDVTTQCFVGGYSKSAQIRNGFEGKEPVDIVVATPGRLADILDDPFVLRQFETIRVKILDEADRLLDGGFERELNQIRNALDDVAAEKSNIPTLLFSATVDRRMRDFASGQFGFRAKIIDTVPENEPEAQELVEQEIVLCDGWSEVYSATLEGINKEAAAIADTGKDFKAIVFLPTSIMVDHFHHVMRRYFEDRGNFNIRAVHGKMTQAARQRAADSFKKSKAAILVATDVVARGMDFPLVTHVFQMGSSGEVAKYIHRIGRTARVGNSGKSILYMDRSEVKFMDLLREAKITNFSTTEYEEGPDFDQALFGRAARISDELEANDLYNNLLGGVASYRRALDIHRHDFLVAQKKFEHMIGLERARMKRAQREIWLQEEPGMSRQRVYGRRY